MLRNKWVILALTFAMLFATGGPYLVWKEKYGGGLHNETAKSQELEKVIRIQQPKDAYDVIVVGTDPEGIAGAVSAARNGLKTLLVDGRGREILGGLMTVGWLNSLDNNYNKDTYDWLAPKPEVLNKGIFQEFYEQIEGTSFDVVTAANAFNRLVKAEPNIDLLLQTQSIHPVLENGTDGRQRLTGVDIKLANGTSRQVKAKAVIDATQDGDLYAAAGVPFTYGKEDLGDRDTRMAVTVVFRLKNADEEFWKEVRKYLENDGSEETGADVYSAWGYPDIKNYKAINPKQAKMRGLNIGRQNDGTILINALQLFGIDATDPASVRQAYEIAEQELPHILAFIQEKHPEFKKLELADHAMAPELYVRETRHMQGLYRLSILDVLENRDQWDRVAFGSYRVDIQSTSPTDGGAELITPYKYAVPFRSLVPQQVDGLLVVGRSASYDSLPHGTARVIPLGMAEAQTAGIAAKVAIDAGVSFREMSESKPLIAKMQETANSQGMDLAPYTPKKQHYQEHPHYEGLKAAVYLGLASGGGTNDFKLDDPSNPKRWVNNLLAVRKKYGKELKGDPNQALAVIKEDPSKISLTLQQACYTAAKAAGLNVTPENSEKELERKRLLKRETVQSITDPQKLTNGEAYHILKDLLEGLLNLRF